MRKNLKYLLIVLGILMVFVSGFIAGNSDEKGEVLSVKNSPTPVFSATPDSESAPQALSGFVVTKVIDGDTMAVSNSGVTTMLRLIGIDTPETVDPRKGIQCFGKEASNRARGLLLGKSVTLETDESQGELDKYKRKLVYVFLPEGINFNLLMIREGFAHEYTYDLPYKYQAEFKAAEREAREKSIGLWSPNACDSSFNQSNTASPSQASGQTEKKQTLGKPNDPGSSNSSSSYECNCSKLCGQISTCDEANYQLNTCGCSARDSDGDGVPCEALCR